MQVGDKPEYIYDANIKFEPEYKPYRLSYSYALLISWIAVFTYLSLRYEKIRSNNGRTLTHQYPL